MTGKPSNLKLNKGLTWIASGALLALAAVVVTLAAGTGPARRPGSLSSMTAQQRTLAAYGTQALGFEPNMGQTDPQVKYLARGNGYTLFLTSKEAVLSLAAPAKAHRKGAQPEPSAPESALHLEMVGAAANASVSESDPQPGVSNY